jgi:uncharacterized integral membrane protein
MPWRLLGLIAILVVLLSFIGVNLNNTCSISFGFVSFSGVPIYLTVFASFILGMLTSLPFIIFSIVKKRQKPEKTPQQQKAPQETAPANTDSYGVD